MAASDFYELFKVGTKVFLDDEHGVIIDLKGHHEFSTFIRWDTAKENDVEDWFSMWGSFFEAGGKIISEDHKFKYINDDGSLKDEFKSK